MGEATGEVRERVLDALANAAGEEAAKMYRAAAGDASSLIRAELAKDHKLLKAIDDKKDAAQVRRMRVYEDAVKRARKTLYYGLRKFNDEERQESLVCALESLAGKASKLSAESADAPPKRETRHNATSAEPVAESSFDTPQLIRALLDTHASTRERSASLDDFHAQMFAALDALLGPAAPLRILDLGCGCYPLSFPRWHRAALYVAADSSKPALRILEAAKHALPLPTLKPRLWSVSEGWPPLLADLPPRPDRTVAPPFDLALMLKLVPLIERHEPESLLSLASVPARTIVITGSKVGLARKDSIETRERKSLERFAAMTGARTISAIDAGEEIGLILHRES